SQEQKASEHHRQPVVPNQNQGITGQREGAEEHERPALAPAIGEPAARVGVKRAEQVLKRAEQADDENDLLGVEKLPLAQALEIFGRKAEPQSLTGTGQHERNQQQRSVASQGQEVSDGSPPVHCPRIAEEPNEERMGGCTA